MQRDAMQTDNQRLKHVKSDGIESGIQSHYARLAGRDGSPRTRKIETHATQTQLSKKPMTGKERKPANAASHLNQERGSSTLQSNGSRSSVNTRGQTLSCSSRWILGLSRGSPGHVVDKAYRWRPQLRCFTSVPGPTDSFISFIIQ